MPVTKLSCLKYHALGNDFLIALDLHAGGDGLRESDASDMARRLCDRHRGVGADGVILVHPPQAGGDVAMELRNADGGRAETSGNGLRCLVLALVESGTVAGPRATVETDGGVVEGSVLPGRSQDGAEVRVSMGRARVGPPDQKELMAGAYFEERRVSTGNPHLVLIGRSLEGVDLAAVGPSLSRSIPGGQNVEVVAPDGSGGLDLVVFERGVGITEACGSGSCAAAAAARAAGLSGDRVPVRNPGGVLVVDLAGALESPAIALTGPACRIARVEVEIELGVPEGVR